MDDRQKDYFHNMWYRCTCANHWTYKSFSKRTDLVHKDRNYFLKCTQMVSSKFGEKSNCVNISIPRKGGMHTALSLREIIKERNYKYQNIKLDNMSRATWRLLMIQVKKDISICCTCVLRIMGVTMLCLSYGLNNRFLCQG